MGFLGYLLLIAFTLFFIGMIEAEGIATKVFGTVGLLFITAVIYSSYSKSVKDKKNRIEEDKISKYEKTVISEYVDKIVTKHKNTLLRKYSECLNTDDYGKESFDYKLFDDHIEYFYDHIFGQEIRTTLEEDHNNIVVYQYENFVRSEIKGKVKKLFLHKSINYGEIENLGCFAFEHECANILRKKGWQASVTKKSGDNGIDIIGWKDGKKSVFQCKKQQSPVGNKAIQEIHTGKTHVDADFAYVVTNNTYTKSAKETAKTTGVTLLHYSDLEKL